MKQLILVFVGFMFFYGIFYMYGDSIRGYFYSEKNTEQSLQLIPEEKVVVEVGNASVQAELALTGEARSVGLSGRTELPQDTGMLFVYDHADYYSFWMPDMHFALDIVWMDTDLNVIDVSENITPESYPEKYTSQSPAQFVLEVPAGYAKEKEIRIGDKAVVHQ